MPSSSGMQTTTSVHKITVTTSDHKSDDLLFISNGYNITIPCNGKLSMHNCVELSFSTFLYSPTGLLLLSFFIFIHLETYGFL